MKNRLAILLVLALTGVLLSSLPAHTDSNPLKFVGVNIDMGIFVASSAALSPDEKFVYVAARVDDSVSVFERNGTSGKLTFVEVLRNGAGVGNGLDGAQSVAVSPDGGNVYVTATGSSNAVTVFSRNPVTGRLTYMEAQQQGVGGITSLDGPSDIVVSPDNKHVYVASVTSDTVTVFDRNLPAGTLSLLEVHQDGVGGVDGLNGAKAISFSPEGNHLYVTGVDDDAVTVFSRNQVNGSLSYLTTYKGADIGPGYLDGADSFAVSPDGKNVYVTSIIDKGLTVFNRNGSTGLLTFTEVHRDGINGVSGLARPEMVKVAPDGKNVYVVGYGGGNNGQLAVFERDPTNGALTYLGKLLNGSGGLSAMISSMSLVLTSDNSYVYVPSLLALISFKRNSADGSLTLIQEYNSANGIQGPVGIAACSCCLYATGAKENALSLFTIKQNGTGQLTYRESRYDGDGGAPQTEGLASARAVAVTSDGTFIYVAGHDDNAVAMFTRSPSGLYMEFVAAYKSTDDGVSGLNGPQSLTLSPDERHLYVASEISSAVAIFSRNLTSGTLTFASSVQNGGPVEGLGQAYAVAISPDNRHAYVAGFSDDALAVFSRNTSSGALTFLEVHRDGVGPVDGLNGANSVAVSPDGAHVYVAGRLDAAVAIFSRNLTSGLLTFQGMVKNGVNGVTGLNGARGLAVSPDRKQVYVASQFDDALAVFSRDPISGALTLAGVHKNGVNGVTGLNTANGIAVNPSGSHIYVSGFDDNAIAVFSRYDINLPLIMKEP